MYTKRLKIRDPFGDLIPDTTKTQHPVVIDQKGGGYILKNLTEQEFENIGRHRFYEALREVNEQARIAEEKKKQAQMNSERVKIFNASIAERQQEQEAQSRHWQLDLHDFILDRGIL